MNGPLSGPAALENASAAYRAAMPIDEHDHVIVGVNPHSRSSRRRSGRVRDWLYGVGPTALILRFWKR